MSVDEGSVDTGAEAPARQVVSLADLQTTVEAMVKQAIEEASGSPAAVSGFLSPHPYREVSSCFSPGSPRMTVCS